MNSYHHASLLVPTQIYLNVKNINHMRKFYTQILGLIIHHESESELVLGSQVSPFLVLVHTPHFQRPSKQESQLYHFAILVQQQTQLAHILQHLVAQGYPLDGASDHQISHAVYLRDPEGNGIELAFDKDKRYWPYINQDLLDGSAMIKPFDSDLYLNMEVGKHYDWHENAILGHVHFHSHDLDGTHHFMIEELKYNLTMNLNNQAHFFSVGGYHHHLGFNRWGNFNTPLSENRLGLRKLVFETTTIDESKVLIDPNGFVFEIHKK